MGYFQKFPEPLNAQIWTQCLLVRFSLERSEGANWGNCQHSAIFSAVQSRLVQCSWVGSSAEIGREVRQQSEADWQASLEISGQSHKEESYTTWR